MEGPITDSAREAMLLAALTRVDVRSLRESLQTVSDPRFPISKPIANALAALRKHRDPSSVHGQGPVPGGAAVCGRRLRRAVPGRGHRGIGRRCRRPDPRAVDRGHRFGRLRLRRHHGDGHAGVGGRRRDGRVRPVLLAARIRRPVRTHRVAAVRADGRGQFPGPPAGPGRGEPGAARRPTGQEATGGRGASPAGRSHGQGGRAGPGRPEEGTGGRLGPAVGGGRCRSRRRCSRPWAADGPCSRRSRRRSSTATTRGRPAWCWPGCPSTPTTPTIRTSRARSARVWWWPARPTHLLVRPGYSAGGVKSRDWKSVPVRYWRQSGFDEPTWIDVDAVRVTRPEVGPIGTLEPDDWNSLW